MFVSYKIYDQVYSVLTYCFFFFHFLPGSAIQKLQDETRQFTEHEQALQVCA